MACHVCGKPETFRTDYDADVDVLYISFRKPQQANDSMMEDDGNIYHYHDDELVGITVLNASTNT